MLLFNSSIKTKDHIVIKIFSIYESVLELNHYVSRHLTKSLPCLRDPLPKSEESHGRPQLDDTANWQDTPHSAVSPHVGRRDGAGSPV